MTLSASVQYLGFRNVGTSRRFLLRASLGTMSREYAVEIPQDAFLRGRAKLQDGPDICYLKVRRELEASALTEKEPVKPIELAVSDDELADYRTAHSPAPSRRFSPEKPATPEAGAASRPATPSAHR